MPIPLEILPYDPQWAVEFQFERDRLAKALADVALRIDHHGSTSVPGLDAKPVIDIQVSVEHLERFERYAAPLRSLGYTHVPHPDDAVCPFFHRPATWPHTHHVHVVEFGGDEEQRTLRFRDYLITHPETAAEYAALKKKLAASVDASNSASRQAYADAKTTFISRVLGLSARQP
ncbi:MAG TPA: GrpB family protein [Terriglobales bacterium]|nr:GrpB family protein [Terriglobales bacterium]